MIFAGIQKSSMVDYPGQLACVLFAPRCNYSCYYCHNRALLDGSWEALDMQEILDFLQKRRGMLDAVVVSGGEASLQPDLPDFLRTLKEMGYLTKLDSNGASPHIIAKLLLQQLCDYYAVDYKAPAARYREFCGSAGDAARVLESIQMLLRNGVDFEVRTTVTPQLTERDLLRMARELPLLPRWTLNPYRIPDDYPEQEAYRVCVKPHSAAELEAFKEALRAIQPNVR